MKCPKCNGKHIIYLSKLSPSFRLCMFCMGKEELDWIENIFGVDDPIKLDSNFVEWKY